MNCIRLLLRRAAAFAAASLALVLAPGLAHAGCGTIWTANLTDHWMWVTIYDLGKTDHYDWGWVAPHNVRDWHAGGARTPMSYMCGSYYHVRGEVKSGKGAQPDGGNIFDTEIQINPQLANWGEMIESVVQMGLTCAAGDEVVCAVKWGLGKGINMAMFGNQSNGGIVCLSTHDNAHFFWVEGKDCANKDVKGPWYAPPKPVKITLKVINPVGHGAKIQNTTVYFNNDHQQVDVLRKGKWSTPTPKDVKIHDDTGRYQVIGKGKGTISWTYNGKTYSASFDAR